MGRFLQQGTFVLRFRYWKKISGTLRGFWYSLYGMQVGKGTYLPKVFITWPHQVSFGRSCTMEQNIYFKYDGIWKKGPSICIADRVFIGAGCEFNITDKIDIGDESLISSGCRFIDHNHGMDVNTLMRSQACKEKGIKIGKDVWLGCNVVVLQGVSIEDGAVVAAGAVVTKSISAKEIWAGVPARKIGDRR